jgi:hypothetical protein
MEEIKNMVHPADKLRKKLKLVFLAYSKKNFFWRQHLSKIVLKMGYVPLNPFMCFDYFLLDSVPRNKIRLANNNLIMNADELWVIGDISDGVVAEIRLAKELKNKIRYFSTDSLPEKLKEVKSYNLKLER